MKNLKQILVFFLLAIACGNVKAQPYSWQWSYYARNNPFTKGNGNKENPWIISTPGQLAYLAWKVAGLDTSEPNYISSGKYYQLEKDIDLLAYEWDVSIGNSVSKPFRGIIDGNNCTIRNIHLDGEDAPILNSIGLLFGCTNGAFIQNLKIEDGRISEFVPKTLGFFIGRAYETTVEKCSAKNFSAESISAGFIGDAYNSTVKNCRFWGDIGVNDINSGGFIGKAVYTTLENCGFLGNVSNWYNGGDNSPAFGGLIGYGESISLIGDCFYEGEMRVNNSINRTGGLVGALGAGGTTIDHCRSTCKIYGQSCIGGLIGHVMKTATVYIYDCTASGSIFGRFCIGGFIGQFEGQGRITGCLAEAHILGFDNGVGGFCGAIYTDYAVNQPTTIADCHFIGNVESGSMFTGGFAAYIVGSNISVEQCSAEGTVTGKDYVGGFAGDINRVPQVTGCYFNGAVKGNDQVGGFAGSISASVSECFAMGSVKGNIEVGGFCGWLSTSFSYNTNDCYAINRVEGNDHVGGFSGRLYQSQTVSSNITKCFSAGTVLCDDPDNKKLCGAFVGISDGNSSFNPNCCFDMQMAEVTKTSGTPNVSGISALSTSELTKNSLLDFSEDKWVFTPGYYPQLKVFSSTKADEAAKLRSALSAVPLKLSDDETIGAVQKIIQLANTTSMGNTIIWSANPDERVSVVNNAVYAFASDAWRTLTLRAGKAERTVIFRTKKDTDLITADILGVKINNTPVNIANFMVGNKFTYPIGCSIEELATTSVFVEITLGGFASASEATMTLFANQPQRTITVTTTDNILPSKPYIFEVKKSLHPDIFIQRWNDVLAINNNFATNGGYIFTGYEWYKGPAKLPSTKGYIQEPGGLDPRYKYTATLTTQQGAKLTTCEAKITTMPNISAVYPNPVQRGQTVRVETGKMGNIGEMGETETGCRDVARNVSTTTAVMQLFDAVGNIISKQTLNNPVSEIVMPDTPGQYILQITANGVSETFKIIVVE